MSFQLPITIATALDRVRKHEYVLPAIQREFVWSTDQIARLFDSLMRGYPIGSFLFWQVDKDHCTDYVFYDFILKYHQRSGNHLEKADLADEQAVTAILDGQQRLTALNIGLRGSHAEKLPNKRVNNPNAYPERRLHLNLCAKATENDLGIEYDFRFMTRERAEDLTRSSGDHWFLVPTIMAMKPGPEMFKFVQTAGLAGDQMPFEALDLLHAVTRRDLLINYFEEESQDLDKVLNIFIRVNSGGTVLSYSDLLLSIATAQWKDVEAREVIHALVDELNATGHGFNLSKDLVLKAGLVLSDIGNIRFSVTNFNAKNMATLEAAWEQVSRALALAVRLVSDFGFSGRTLTADTVIIPIAYYLHKRRATAAYLNSAATYKDRDAIRRWVVRSLLKSGVWGSAIDTLLAGLRGVIQEYGNRSFPVEQIETEMTRQGKSLRFEEDEVQDLLESEYGDKKVVAILSLLYPGMDFRNEFHLDHVFPVSQFRQRVLAKAGIPEDEIAGLREKVNLLPNLQLLEGSINVSKSDMLPAQWAVRQFPDATARAAYFARHDLGDMPQSILGFDAFFSARRIRIVAKLRELLDVVPTAMS